MRPRLARSNIASRLLYAAGPLHAKAITAVLDTPFDGESVAAGTTQDVADSGFSRHACKNESQDQYCF